MTTSAHFAAALSFSRLSGGANHRMHSPYVCNTCCASASFCLCSGWSLRSASFPRSACASSSRVECRFGVISPNRYATRTPWRANDAARLTIHRLLPAPGSPPHTEIVPTSDAPNGKARSKLTMPDGMTSGGSMNAASVTTSASDTEPSGGSSRASLANAVSARACSSDAATRGSCRIASHCSMSSPLSGLRSASRTMRTRAGGVSASQSSRTSLAYLRPAPSSSGRMQTSRPASADQFDL